MQSFIDSFIDPTGWRECNTGPRSVTIDRVAWAGYHEIDDTDAADFTVSNFVVGDYWLPPTGVLQSQTKGKQRLKEEESSG
uniref:Pectinesterase n=1 Tax=Nelumbo nucifera TaxID=4432 RepID=A0A822Z8P9_NELNU|nr:TPA_asm: hypothetical protein HUJ06_015293 [Nelumbo nucifera]